MVSGSARGILLAGVVIGSTIIGAMLGAGLDFFTGNQGWWGVGLLAGLMVAGILAARLLEGRPQPGV